MHSAELKKRFRETYLSFFSKNRLVLSMPFVIKWCGDRNKKNNGIFIRQKIPLRIFVGTKPNQEKCFRFKTISYFDTYEDRFITTELLEYLPHLHEAERHINELFGEYFKKEGGCDLSVISELSRSVGVGFEGVFSELVAAVLQTIRGRFDPTLQKAINNTPLHTLAKTDGPAAEILRLGTQIERYMRNGVASIGGYAAAFFDSHYPIVSFSSDTEHSEHQVYAYRFNELFEDLPPLPHLPVDYGVIYSGKPAMLDQIQQAYVNDQTWIPKVHTLFRATFEKHFAKIPENEYPRFYKDYVEDADEGLDGSFGRIAGAISLEIFYALSLLYRGGYKESNIRNFIQAIDKHRYSDYITQKVSVAFKIFINELIKNIGLEDRLFGIIPNHTMIMGGSVTFMMPIEGNRHGITQALSETRKRFPDSRFIYCSWLDGSESNGLIFEQSIEHGVYSSFIRENSVLLSRSDGIFEFGSFEELIKTPDLDIIFDTINTRVYVRGKRLTSKELHSQGTTIEVFSLLLEHASQEVSNKHLPISSYSLNRNEMQGKILKPLMRALRDETEKEMDVVISGGTSDYSMRLETESVRIGVVKKI